MGETEPGNVNSESIESYIYTIFIQKSSISIFVCNEFDSINAQELERTTKLLIDGTETTRDIILNLKDISYIDSMGLRTLVNLHRNCQEKDLNFALSDPSERVMRIIELSGLVEQFTVINSDENPGIQSE